MFWYDLHFAATFYMIGVIWLVQLVHYPLFSAFDSADFSRTMLAHQAGTTWVVLPVMLLELGSGLLICSSGAGSSYWIATSLLLIIWLVTFGVSVPLHAKLSKEKNLAHVRKLVATNWIRTLLWTTRGGLLLIARGAG